MGVLGNKVKGRNLTNEFLVPAIKVHELGVERDVGLLAKKHFSAVAAAVCTTPRYAVLHCGVVLSIRQPFGGISFFSFYRSGDWYRTSTISAVSLNNSMKR